MLPFFVWRVYVNYLSFGGCHWLIRSCLPYGAPEFTPVYSGVRVTQSLALCVCFVDRRLSFCTFSFGHCVVCSSIYGFWLPLWYLQALLLVVLNIKFASSIYFKKTCRLVGLTVELNDFSYNKHSLLKTQISDQIFNYLIKCNKLFCRKYFSFVEVKGYI
jgi:hypothetical protein